MSTDVSGRTTRLRQFMKHKRLMETLFVHSASLSVINGQIFRLLLKISVEEKKKNETIEHFFRLSDFAELFNQQKKSSTENRYN